MARMKIASPVTVEGSIYLYRWDGVTHYFDHSVPARLFHNPSGYVVKRGRNDKGRIFLVCVLAAMPWAGWVDEARCEAGVVEVTA